MIDWAATERALGRPQTQVRVLDKVVVVCERCQRPRRITYNAAKQRTDHPCMSCKKRKGEHKTGDPVEHVCACGAKAILEYRADRFQNWNCHACGLKRAHAEGKYAGILGRLHTREITPAERQQIGEAAAARWQDEDYRAKWSESRAKTKEARSATSRLVWSDQKRLAKLSASLKAVWATPEYRSTKTAQSRTLWEQAEYREAQAAGLGRPEVRAAISAASYRLWLERRELLVELIRQNLSQPEVLAKLSEASKRAWQDPEYRGAVLAGLEQAWQNQELKAQAAATSKLAWQDPEYRANVSAAVRLAWQDPEYRARVVEASKLAWEDLELRANASTASKLAWEDSKYRDAVLAGLAKAWEDPEYRATISEASRLAWEDPEYRARMALARAIQPRVSSIQEQLYCYLDDLGVAYYREGPETAIGHYVFDCLIPGRDGRKHLLVECQGDYWHSLPKAAQNDRSKFTYVDRYFPEYEVMYLWEHEFAAAGRVLDRLRARLGLALEPVDFAFGELRLAEPAAKELKSFLDAYHYIGKDRGGKSLGAYLGGELVGAVVYSPPLRQNTAGQFALANAEVRELSRLCIHPSYHKRNFASWLVSRSLKALPGTRLVVAYADRTVGHSGTVYRAAGFELHHEVPPDYWYVDHEGFVMHKRTLYGKAVKFGIAEAAYAARFGYLKQWGGPKLCFVRRVST